MDGNVDQLCVGNGQLGRVVLGRRLSSDVDQLCVGDGKGGVDKGRSEKPDPEGGHGKGGHRGKEGHCHREVDVS